MFSAPLVTLDKDKIACCPPRQHQWVTIVYIKRYQNMKYKNSPYYVGSELWNNLPIDVIHSPTLQQFKVSLRRLYKTYKDDN